MMRNILFLGTLVLLSSCLTNKKPQEKSNTSDFFKKGVVSPLKYKNPVGDTLKILSWNVEHFVDDFDNPYTRNRREDEHSKMEGRVSLLVQALKKADADIVVLQEFESAQFLKQIANDSLKNMKYKFFADYESINWYMNVVVMSRVPLGIMYGYGSVTTPLTYMDKKTGKEVYETQSRINTRLWSVDVLVNENYSFLLTGVHLKAGRRSRDVAMRMGQIQFLKGQYERFLNENSEKNILVVGDFNAKPNSKEVQFMLDGNSPAKFIDNLGPKEFTHPADKPKWRIDHILPNDNMNEELVKGSMKVKYFFDVETQEKLADHLPLVAKFITRD